VMPGALGLTWFLNCQLMHLQRDPVPTIEWCIA
jgi:hypothetical protein